MRKVKVYVTAIGQRCLSWTSMVFSLEKVASLVEPGFRGAMGNNGRRVFSWPGIETADGS